jgi:hypothetical protein
MDYWYDAQIRRYLLQFMRVFSGFQVSEGNRDGTVYYNKIPVRYADMNRMVSHVIRKGSENLVGSTPFMSCSIQSLLIARDRAQDPFFVNKVQVAERQYDPVSGAYSTSEESQNFSGNLYTTDRYMPVPYNLTMNVDLWSSNTDQKLQILEQLLILFNPSLVLQSSSNPLDWTSLFEVELTDLQWSNRSIPAGVDETIDIATLTFTLPIWLSPPAKVKRQKIINTIVTNIYDVDNIEDLGYDQDIFDFFRTVDEESPLHVITPNNYKVEVIGTDATLYKDNGDTLANWNDLLEVLAPQGAQGSLSDPLVDIDDIPLTTGSTLQLNISNNIDSNDDLITGVIVRNSVDPSKLVFTLDTDTLPSNTLINIDRIINPNTYVPGDGNLAIAQAGQRYLLIEEITHPAWGIAASADDIIQYNGAQWTVVFDASTTEATNYVTNTYTSKQYKWENLQWTSTYEGIYNPGYWRINV